MVEEKIGRRMLLMYALDGIDTAIIAAAKRLDREREICIDEGAEITRLSDIRKLICCELNTANDEDDYILTT